MKKILLLLLLLLPTLSFSQECYTIGRVVSRVETESINEKRIIFGIKQMAEEVLSEKYDLCIDGIPIFIEVLSIEAPTTGIEIAFFSKKKKVTEVTIAVLIKGETLLGKGSAKSTVKATFLDLNDKNLPFKKTVFSSAVKKALEDIL